MRAILEEIGTIGGVRAACICDLEGKVLARSEFEAGAKLDLREVACEVALVLAVFRLTGKTTTDMDLAYDGSRLLACAVGSALLIVICEPQVDAALLRLGLNVQKSRLREDRKFQTPVDTAELTSKIVREGIDEVSRHLLRNVVGMEVKHA
jgi:hypothetical protein